MKIHWTQNILEPCIPACGLSTFHRRMTSRNKAEVTCVRCLRLIMPSQPVERRATVAECETAKSLSTSARHLYSRLEDIQMGFSVTIELSTALDHLGDAIQDHISAIDDSRLALLERLLREIVEAATTPGHEQWTRLEAAIEAARGVG